MRINIGNIQRIIIRSERGYCFQLKYNVIISKRIIFQYHITLIMSKLGINKNMHKERHPDIPPTKLSCYACGKKQYYSLH